MNNNPKRSITIFDDKITEGMGRSYAGAATDWKRNLITRRGALPGNEVVMAALKSANGHRAEAALALGVSERTLYRHLKKMRISAESSSNH